MQDSNYYAKGSFIDYQNTVGNWIPTKIYNVNFSEDTIEIYAALGKSDILKLSVNSNRIAPFRVHTRPDQKVDKLEYSLDKYLKVNSILIKTNENLKLDSQKKYYDDLIALNYKKGDMLYVVKSCFSAEIPPDLVWSIVNSSIGFYHEYLEYFTDSLVENYILYTEEKSKAFSDFKISIASYFSDLSEIINLILGKSKEFSHFLMVKGKNLEIENCQGKENFSIYQYIVEKLDFVKKYFLLILQKLKPNTQYIEMVRYIFEILSRMNSIKELSIDFKNNLSSLIESLLFTVPPNRELLWDLVSELLKPLGHILGNRETLELRLACMYLKSDLFEKKLRAIIEIKKRINGNLSQSSLSASQQVKILIDEGAVNELLSPNIHNEILKKSSDIFAFLIKFNNSIIPNLCNSLQNTKYEDFAENLKELIDDLIEGLDVSQIDFIYERMFSICDIKNSRNWDFLFNLSKKMIYFHNSNNEEDVKEKKVYGLDRFLAILLNEDSDINMNINEGKKLCDICKYFFDLPILKDQLPHYFKLILQNLNECKNIAISIMLIHDLINIFEKKLGVSNYEFEAKKTFISCIKKLQNLISSSENYQMKGFDLNFSEENIFNYLFRVTLHRNLDFNLLLELWVYLLNQMNTKVGKNNIDLFLNQLIENSHDLPFSTHSFIFECIIFPIVEGNSMNYNVEPTQFLSHKNFYYAFEKFFKLVKYSDSQELNNLDDIYIGSNSFFKFFLETNNSEIILSSGNVLTQIFSEISYNLLINQQARIYYYFVKEFIEKFLKFYAEKNYDLIRRLLNLYYLFLSIEKDVLKRQAMDNYAVILNFKEKSELNTNIFLPDNCSLGKLLYRISVLSEISLESLSVEYQVGETVVPLTQIEPERRISSMTLNLHTKIIYLGVKVNKETSKYISITNMILEDLRIYQNLMKMISFECSS